MRRWKREKKNNQSKTATQRIHQINVANILLRLNTSILKTAQQVREMDSKKGKNTHDA